MVKPNFTYKSLAPRETIAGNLLRQIVIKSVAKCAKFSSICNFYKIDSYYVLKVTYVFRDPLLTEMSSLLTPETLPVKFKSNLEMN